MGPSKSAIGLDKRVIREDSDYVYDMRLARRWKRRRFAVDNAETDSYSDTIKKKMEDPRTGDGMVDEDYKIFLNALGEYGEAQSAEEDDTDPQYKMFWENLREDGNSYVLELPIDDEMSIVIKYEEDDGSDDERNPHTPKKVRNVSSGEKMESSKILGNVPSKERRNSVVGNNLESVPVDRFSRGTNGHFSQKPGPRGLHSSKIESSKTLGNIPSKKRKNSVVGKNLESIPVDCFSRGTNGHFSQKPGPRGLHSSCQRELEDEMVDESYQIFLNGLGQDGNCLVFTTEDGKQVKYEEDDESSSDSEILVTDSAPYCDEGTYMPFVTSKVYDSTVVEDDGRCFGSLRSNRSRFREKLMDVLRMRYDPKEYDELYKEITNQKQKERHRDLRGRIKSYSDQSSSKSYLDHYPDLKKKINSFKHDRRKVLNLVRGFFYWLKNLSHEGAFPPWLDNSCLGVMPGHN